MCLGEPLALLLAQFPPKSVFSGNFLEISKEERKGSSCSTTYDAIPMEDLKCRSSTGTPPQSFQPSYPCWGAPEDVSLSPWPWQKAVCQPRLVTSRSSHLPALVGWPLGGFLCEPCAPGPGERRGRSGQSEGLEAPPWPMERCLRFLRQWNPQTSGAPTVPNMRQGPFPPSPKLLGSQRPPPELGCGTPLPVSSWLPSPKVPLRHTALQSYTCWGWWSREMGGLLGPSGAPQWS